MTDRPVSARGRTRPRAAGQPGGHVDPVTTTDQSQSSNEPASRFLTVDDVGEELNISRVQAYALVRSGALAGIKIGGRGQWRVERSVLEEYIAQAYKDTARHVKEHPLDAKRTDTGLD